MKYNCRLPPVTCVPYKLLKSPVSWFMKSKWKWVLGLIMINLRSSDTGQACLPEAALQLPAPTSQHSPSNSPHLLPFPPQSAVDVPSRCRRGLSCSLILDRAWVQYYSMANGKLAPWEELWDSLVFLGSCIGKGSPTLRSWRWEVKNSLNLNPQSGKLCNFAVPWQHQEGQGCSRPVRSSCWLRRAWMLCVVRCEGSY